MKKLWAFVSKPRNLSLSHSHVGDVLAKQGDSAAALAAYHRDLAISKRNADLDPTNTRRQREIFHRTAI